MSWGAIQESGFIPPGRYIYDGPGISLTQGNVILCAIPGTVTIEITQDVYFVTHSGDLPNLLISGIHFVGGRGAFVHTRTADNVKGRRIVEKCHFDGYTRCAIGGLSENQPYWRIRDNDFMGSPAGGTKGICLKGWLDVSEIRGNSFLRNKYHLQLGGRLGNNVVVAQNDFLQWTDGIVEADILLVPNSTDAEPNNSGYGSHFKDNRFSSEHASTDKPRVLIALEDGASGADDFTRAHSPVWNTTAHLSGIRWSNTMIGAVISAAPFIKSYVSRLNRWTWDGGDTTIGGSHSYLVEFMGEEIDEDARYSRTWDVRLGDSKPGVQPFTSGLSNRVLGNVIDPFCIAGGDESVILPGSSDDVGLVLLVKSPGGSGLNLNGGTTITQITDDIGNANQAAQINFAGPDTSAVAYRSLNTLGTPQANRRCWIDVGLKMATTQSLAKVRIDVYNTTTNKFAFQKYVNLPASFKRLIATFILPNSSDMAAWIVRIVPVDYGAGVSDRACMARLFVYHSRAVQNIGHIRTLAGGTFSEGHLKFMDRSLWYETSSRFRTLGSTPGNASGGGALANGVTATAAPGDASFTQLVNSSAATQIWNVPLTANRTWTLPSAGAFDGEVLTAVRTAAATGAFDLLVKTSSGTTLATLSSENSRVAVQYSVAIGAWIVLP